MIFFIAFSFSGMQLVAYSNRLTPRLLGIVLASISCGAGELSFLQLTHWHDRFSLPAFAMGIGMAGLVGAYLYLAMTTWMGLSVHASLNVSSVSILSMYLILVSSLFARRGIFHYSSWSYKIDGEV